MKRMMDYLLDYWSCMKTSFPEKAAQACEGYSENSIPSYLILRPYGSPALSKTVCLAEALNNYFNLRNRIINRSFGDATCTTPGGTIPILICLNRPLGVIQVAAL